jgi:methionyl-tRNA formyltransferase
MTAAGRLRVAFLGTPDAAVPSLRALAAIADVPIVITQPDRPQGRSKRPQPPPVRVVADELGLAVAQPERSVEISSMLAAAGPLDAAVLVAFGQLIRPDALAVPRRGFLNVHFSILPRWRGAAPVQRAIMAGDRRLGVTVMVLEAGLDTGPTVATWSTGLGALESGGSVLARLSVGGAALMARVLEPYVHGRLAAITQPGAPRWLPRSPPPTVPSTGRRRPSTRHGGSSPSAHDLELSPSSGGSRSRSWWRRRWTERLPRASSTSRISRWAPARADCV